MKKLMVGMLSLMSVGAVAEELWTATVCEQGHSLDRAITKLNGSTKRGNQKTYAFINPLTGRVDTAEFRVREVSGTSVTVNPNEIDGKYTVCATVYR